MADKRFGLEPPRQRIDASIISRLAALIVIALVVAAGYASFLLLKGKNSDGGDVARYLKEARATGEIVEYFGVDLEISRSGILTVDQVIRAVSAGKRFYKGLAPAIMRQHQALDGSWNQHSYSILRTLLDGKKEFHEIGNHSPILDRLYIYDKEKSVSPGPHTYEISYRVYDTIEHGSSHDQFVWVVIGDFWTLPIKSAVVNIRLPKDIPPENIQYSAFLSTRNGKKTVLQGTEDPDQGGIRFWSHRMVKPLEEMIVKVRWPTGHIKPIAPIH